MQKRFFIKIKKYTAILAFIPLMIACNNSNEIPLFQPFDLTKEQLFTDAEGPAVDKEGNLYAVAFEKDETIGVIAPNEPPKLFVELPEGSTGCGIRFNSKGEMLVADYTGHTILRINTQSKEISTLAHEPRMNQPNDLAINDNDILFASDPNWKNGTGNIWRITPDGTVTLLDSLMGTTNGIEVSPDNKRLYVNESKQQKIWVFDLDAEGNISNKQLFHSFKEGGLDGMRCDINGSLWVTRYNAGAVAVISPDGMLTKEVKMKGICPTNVTFGGKDNKYIYVTMQDRGCIEYFRTDVAGAR